MKQFKNVLMLITWLVVSFVAGNTIAHAVGAPESITAFSVAIFATGLIPRGTSYSFLVGPDVSVLTTAFVQFGGQILRKQVNSLMLGSGVTTFRNVNKPVAMPKLSAVGNPRPYSAADSTTNGVAFTDRTLTAFQSKWDIDIDPEQYRNTYLAQAADLVSAGKPVAPFYEYILDQVGTELMAQINNSTLFFGVRNAAGTGAVDIADGFVTKLKAEVTAATLAAITLTGGITAANAVTQVETFLAAQPSWWREKDVVVNCSYATFDNYKKHYRTLNAFGFQPRSNGQYYVDGWANAILQPVSGLGSNAGVLGSVNKPLCFGTDGDSIAVAASQRRNIIELRLMMPFGTQIADLECVSVDTVLVA